MCDSPSHIIVYKEYTISDLSLMQKICEMNYPAASLKSCFLLQFLHCGSLFLVSSYSSGGIKYMYTYIEHLQCIKHCSASHSNHPSSTLAPMALTMQFTGAVSTHLQHKYIVY